MNNQLTTSIAQCSDSIHHNTLSHSYLPQKDHSASGDLLNFKSPRSAMSMKLLGMTKNELLYLTFDQYRLSFPGTQCLPHNFQRSQYLFYNNHRKHKIEEVIATRSLISIDDCSLTDDISNRRRSLTFHKDIKRLERLKSQNEREMMNEIASGLKRIIFYKRDARQRQRDYQSQIEKQKAMAKKKALDTQQRMAMENHLREVSVIEKEVNCSISKEKLFQERVIIEEGDEIEKLKQIEMSHRRNEDEVKQRELLDKVNAMKMDFIRRIKKKQCEVELRQRKRKEKNELKRLCKSIEYENDYSMRKERILMNRAKRELNLNDKREAIIAKDRKSSLRKELIELKRWSNSIEMKEKAENKAKDITQALEVKQLEIDQKTLDYFDHQRELEGKHQVNEVRKQEGIEQLKSKAVDKRSQVHKAQIDIESKLNEKKEMTSMRIKEKWMKEQTYNELKQIEAFLHSHERINKAFVQEDQRRNLNNRRRFNEEEKLRLIKEKQGRVESYFNKKAIVNKEVIRIERGISQRRAECKERIESFFSSNSKSFNCKAIQRLREFFPEEKRFDRLLLQVKEAEEDCPKKPNAKMMKKQRKSLSMTGLKRPSQIDPKAISNFSLTKPRDKDSTCPSNATISNEEIEQAQQEKRRQLSKQLDILLMEDQIIEQLRQYRITNAKPNHQRVQIEKDIQRERIEASKKIVQLNDSIEKEVILLGIALKNKATQ